MIYRITLLVLIAQLCNGQSSDTSKTLNEVHIQSVRASHKMTSSSSMIKARDLSHLNLGQDIPVLLNQLPSVNTSTDAGNGVGYSSMYIRGMDAQRIQVNVNGIPYNDAESQEVYWVNMPDIMSSTDDIQVQRGIGFSSMGGNGIGGTISIKSTKKYDKPFAQLSTNFGSFNTSKNSIQASTGLLNNGWQITTRHSLIQSDGYIDRAASNLSSNYLDISKYGEKFTTHLIANIGRERTYQSWYGLSANDYNARLLTKNIAGTDYESKSGSPYADQIDNYNQSQFQWINNVKIGDGHNFSFIGYVTNGKGYYEEYKVGADYSTYSSDLTGNGDLKRQLWLNNNLYGLNLSNVIEKGKISNTTAFSYSSYQGNHFGKIKELLGSYTGTIPNEYYYSSSEKIDFTAFNKLVISTGQSNFIIDLQIRTVNYNALGSLDQNGTVKFNKNYRFFNPKLGWNCNLNAQNKVYLFAGMSHREPTRSDFLTEDSSSQPKPEKVINIEFGYQTTRDRSDLKINLFGMRFMDQLIPTGAINQVGAPIRQNVSYSYRAGAELEFRYKLNAQWSIYTNQYFAINKITDYTNYNTVFNPDYTIHSVSTYDYPSTNIAFSPGWISYAELSYSPWKSTYLKLINKVISSQYLDNTSDQSKSIPTYSFTNLSASHTIKTSGLLKAIELNLLLNNIFDSHYLTRGYTYNTGDIIQTNGNLVKGKDMNYYFPQAGFNVLAGMNFRF